MLKENEQYKEKKTKKIMGADEFHKILRYKFYKKFKHQNMDHLKEHVQVDMVECLDPKVK